MLLPQTIAEQSRGDVPHGPEMQKEPQQRRYARRFAGLFQHARDQAFLHGDLHALDDLHRPFAALLDGGEQRLVDRTAVEQRLRQRIRGGDRVLDREIDADAPDRRHRVRSVADQQQARLVPALQPVHLHGQRADGVP